MKQMFFSIDPAAKKALSLKKDAVFRLLVLMMILLGWLSSMAAAGLGVFEGLYSQWQLSQKNHVSLYLMPDSPPVEIEALKKALFAQRGVVAITALSQEEVKNLVTPYLGEHSTLPLPKILDVRVTPQVDKDRIYDIVLNTFPQAEVEDGRDMLQQIARGVRFVQVGALLMAAIAFLVLALLVAFTVRSGLRAQRRALSVLQYVGATEKFLTVLVLQQVWYRAFFGAGVAAAISFLTLFTVQIALPDFASSFTIYVWAAGCVMPLLLMGVVMAAAYGGVRQTLRQGWV